MKKIIYYMTALVLASGTLTSCNDYLDTVQNKGNDEVLTSGKQIEALFANSEMFNTKAIYNVFASDDYGLTTDHLMPWAMWTRTSSTECRGTSMT